MQKNNLPQQYFSKTRTIPRPLKNKKQLDSQFHPNLLRQLIQAQGFPCLKLLHLENSSLYAAPKKKEVHIQDEKR